MTKQRDPLTTIDEVANYFAVSVSTIRQWTRAGYIPDDTIILIGNKTYRYDLGGIIDAMQHNKVPRPELEETEDREPEASMIDPPEVDVHLTDEDQDQ